MDRLFTIFPLLVYPWSLIAFIIIPLILITFEHWWWLTASVGIGCATPLSFIALSALLAWKRGKLIDERTAR